MVGSHCHWSVDPCGSLSITTVPTIHWVFLVLLSFCDIFDIIEIVTDFTVKVYDIYICNTVQWLKQIVVLLVQRHRSLYHIWRINMFLSSFTILQLCAESKPSKARAKKMTQNGWPTGWCTVSSVWASSSLIFSSTGSHFTTLLRWDDM